MKPAHAYTLALAATLFVPGATLFAQGPTAIAKGKISRNMYRIPYANNSAVTMNQDYIDHGSTPAGDVGSMDMNGPAGSAIVAAADGTVIGVRDNLNGCGCNAVFGPCGNFVQIRHANGEVSFYLHIAQNSATNSGIAVNTVVTQGQQIGVEGDVGWTCGGGSAPRNDACTGVATLPTGTGNCGPHLHWNVVRETTGERVNPMTCGINNNLYRDNSAYTADACSICCCPFNSDLSGMTFDAFGEWRVFQAENQLTASTVQVNNFGSLVLHAGSRVRMLPGFHVDAGGYARAEIGTCNATAVAPSAPVTAGIVEGRPAIDLSHEREGF